MLGKGKQTTTQTTRGMAPWACLIGTLSFCLWGANALPIQHVQYQLVTNLAISQHRMATLQKLQGKSDLTIQGNATPLASLEILDLEKRAGANSNSELRSVRVRIRCPHRTDTKEIEKALSELTVPSMESDECMAFSTQLTKERWLLESCKHTLRRLELDCEHDKLAIETIDTGDTTASNRTNADNEGVGQSGADFSNGTSEGNTTDNSANSVNRTADGESSPFRLASYGTRENLPQSQSMLIENLRHLVQARSENLDSMSQTFDRLKARSRGFLSFTGSPSLEPVVRPLTGARLIVLFSLCATVWLILMLWLNPAWSRVLVSNKPKPAKVSSKPIPVLPTATSRRPSRNIDKTIQWMRREGIPYLGEVQVFVDDSAESGFVSHSSSQSLMVPMSETEQQPDRSDATASIVISVDSLNWLRSLSEGSIVLWIGLFAARFMFDPAWRELVSMAPLAAITRMISGIE